MGVYKQLDRLNKKGANILATLTKAEEGLDQHITEQAALYEDIERELTILKDKQSKLLASHSENKTVLQNIRTLLGKDIDSPNT